MADTAIMACGVAVAAAAVPLEEGADWSVMQEAASVIVGGARVVDLTRVGGFPGPRSAEKSKNMTHVFSAVQPSIDVFDVDPKPLLTDLYIAALGGGGPAAAAHERGVRVVLHAAMEYLFSRPHHGGMRIVENTAVFLPSVFSAAPPTAPGLCPTRVNDGSQLPGCNGGNGGGRNAGGTQGVGDGAKKRAHSDLDAAVESVEEAASKKLAASGISEEDDAPLFTVFARSQWSAQFTSLSEFVPELGRARSVGSAVCVDVLGRVQGRLMSMETLNSVDDSDFKQERPFTGLLLGIIKEVQMSPGIPWLAVSRCTTSWRPWYRRKGQ